MDTADASPFYIVYVSAQVPVFKRRINVSNSTPKVQIPKLSHSKSQAVSIADTIGCLHAYWASHSSKNCVGISSASPHRLHVASLTH